MKGHHCHVRKKKLSSINIYPWNHCYGDMWKIVFYLDIYKKNIHRTASFNKNKRFGNIKLVSFRHFLSTFLNEARKSSGHVCVDIVSAILLLYLELVWRCGICACYELTEILFYVTLSIHKICMTIPKSNQNLWIVRQEKGQKNTTTKHWSANQYPRKIEQNELWWIQMLRKYEQFLFH